MSIRSDKFEFFTKENEQIDATIKVYEEKNSVIHGVVVDCKNKPVKNAVVKLLEKINTPQGIKLIPLTHAFTDSCGQFLFGPLCPNKKYVLKVWYNNVSIRTICFDNSDCDEKPHCIQSGNTTNYPICDHEDSILTHHNDCDCHHESHSHYQDYDKHHEDVDHQHDCDCHDESHSHLHECDCNHETYSHLEEFQKKFELICESKYKEDNDQDDEFDLPMKKSKERSHHHRSRHHKEDFDD